ncbi:MAG: type II secretion system protein, partial [Candidatus Pacebacteria bacterium]|nr:type II secretion system protein [Candidatus Paceibacterota bacterium]
MKEILKKSFTLIELLVVIAIIGILSGLIVVTMNGVTAKANIAKSQVFSNSLRNALMLNLVSEWKFDGSGLSDGATANTSYFVDTWSQKNGSVTATPPTVLSGNNCVSNSCLAFNSQFISVAYDPVFKFGTKMAAMVWAKGVASGV